MRNPFDNPELPEIQKILSEQQGGGSKTVVQINGKVAKWLDYAEDKNDPTVYFYGMGTMRLSQMHKMIKMDLADAANNVGRIDAKRILASLISPDRNPSAARLHGLVEVEEFMNSPEGKRRITMAKKT